MTTYTADGFKNARFATHPDGRIAARLIGGKPFCPSWILQAVGGVAHRSDHVMAQEGWVPLGENPRPLTADDITDEMIRRARTAWLEFARTDGTPTPEVTREMLSAALTEPPARPEGAGEIEAWLDGMPESIRLDGDEHQRLFANHLAHMGFRIPAVMEEGR